MPAERGAPAAPGRPARRRRGAVASGVAAAALALLAAAAAAPPPAAAQDGGVAGPTAGGGGGGPPGGALGTGAAPGGGPASARGAFDAAGPLRGYPGFPSAGALEGFGVPRGLGGAGPPGSGPPGGGRGLGGVLDYFEGGAPSPARAYDIQAALGASVLATDNLRNDARGGRRGDIGLTLLPELFGTVDTSRVVASLGYFPTLSYFVNTPSQNRINHRFNGQARAELVDDLLFLDLRAVGAVQATGGGFAPQGSVLVDRANQVQSTSLQASPFLVQRFGGVATAIAGYAYRLTRQDGQDAFAPGAAQPFFTSQDAEGHEVFGVVRSGEDFGRLGLEARAIASRFSGTGVLDGAYRNIATLQARYAFTRWLTGLVEGGYEDFRYSGVVPYEAHEPVWSFGARLSPSDNSALTVRYGRRNGFNSASVDGYALLGVRTQVSVSYGETIGASALQSTDLLTNTRVDALGNPVDSQAGVPVVLPFAGSALGPLGGPLDPGLGGYGVAPAGGSFLALQSSLLRIRRALATASQAYDRDSFSLTLLHEERTPLTTVSGIAPFSQKADSASLGWSRVLTPDMSLFAGVQYGRFRSSVAGGSGDTYSARVGLSRLFRPGLTGSVQYAFTYRTNGLFATQAGTPASTGRDSTQNLVIATVRQAF